MEGGLHIFPPEMDLTPPVGQDLPHLGRQVAVSDLDLRPLSQPAPRPAEGLPPLPLHPTEEEQFHLAAPRPSPQQARRKHLRLVHDQGIPAPDVIDQVSKDPVLDPLPRPVKDHQSGLVPDRRGVGGDQALRQVIIEVGQLHGGRSPAGEEVQWDGEDDAEENRGADGKTAY